MDEEVGAATLLLPVLRGPSGLLDRADVREKKKGAFGPKVEGEVVRFLFFPFCFIICI
jgi:hypothetical protein